MGNPAAIALPGSDSESRELSYNFTALEAGNLPNQWQTIRRFNSVQTTTSSVETQHAASLLPLEFSQRLSINSLPFSSFAPVTLSSGGEDPWSL